MAAVLASIADEVHARTVLLCATITVEFSGRIRLAHKTKLRDYMAAVITALKQARKEAIKLLQENAEIKIKQRQKRQKHQ